MASRMCCVGPCKTMTLVIIAIMTLWKHHTFAAMPPNVLAVPSLCGSTTVSTSRYTTTRRTTSVSSTTSTSSAGSTSSAAPTTTSSTDSSTSSTSTAGRTTSLAPSSSSSSASSSTSSSTTSSSTASSSSTTANPTTTSTSSTQSTTSSSVITSSRSTAPRIATTVSVQTTGSATRTTSTSAASATASSPSTALASSSSSPISTSSTSPSTTAPFTVSLSTSGVSNLLSSPSPSSSSRASTVPSSLPSPSSTAVPTATTTPRITSATSTTTISRSSSGTAPTTSTVSAVKTASTSPPVPSTSSSRFTIPTTSADHKTSRPTTTPSSTTSFSASVAPASSSSSTAQPAFSSVITSSSVTPATTASVSVSSSSGTASTATGSTPKSIVTQTSPAFANGTSSVTASTSTRTSKPASSTSNLAHSLPSSTISVSSTDYLTTSSSNAASVRPVRSTSTAVSAATARSTSTALAPYFIGTASDGRFSLLTTAESFSSSTVPAPQFSSTSSIAATATTTIDSFNVSDANATWENFLMSIGFSLQSSDDVAQTTAINAALPYVLAPLSPDLQAIVGMQWSSTFLKCTYDQKNCLSLKDFRLDFTAMYGSCFTYNFDARDIRQAYRPGVHHGLKITLSTNADDYVCTSMSSGFKISLQGQTESPLPETGGFYAHTGVRTTVVIAKKTITSIDHCTGTPDPASFYYTGSYTVEGCVRACYQRYAIGHCNCADPRFAKPSYERYCNTSDMPCLEKLLACGEVDVMQETNCTCQKTCSYVEYTTTVTASTINFNSVFWIDICAQSGVGRNYCTEYLENNIAIIEIYYDKLSEITYDEEGSYSLIAFLSDISAYVSMYFGFAMVFLVEIVFLFLELMNPDIPRRIRTYRSNHAMSTVPIVSDYGS